MGKGISPQNTKEERKFLFPNFKPKGSVPFFLVSKGKIRYNFDIFCSPKYDLITLFGYQSCGKCCQRSNKFAYDYSLIWLKDCKIDLFSYQYSNEGSGSNDILVHFEEFSNVKL